MSLIFQVLNCNVAVVNCVTVVEVRSDVDFVDLVENMSKYELCYGVQRD